MDRQKIMTRLDALLRKARNAGSSDAEMKACMAQAQKLMATYGISEADLASVTNDDYKGYNVDKPAGRKNFDPVVRYMGGAIAKLTGCAAYLSSPNRGEDGQIVFYGLASDVEYAKWLLHSFQTLMNDQWALYKTITFEPGMSRDTIARHRIGFVRGFCSGAYTEVLKPMLDKNSNDPEVRTSNALVVKKTELATQALAKNEGINLGGHATSMRGRGSAHSGAQGAGYNAGASATMGAAVGRSPIAIGKS